MNDDSHRRRKIVARLTKFFHRQKASGASEFSMRYGGIAVRERTPRVRHDLSNREWERRKKMRQIVRESRRRNR